jgi:hypothetical protein
VIHMKANDVERKKFDKSLDDILDLFNNLEDDIPLVDFKQDVVDNIEIAKKMYGDDMVSQKINTVVSEMLSWLPLDEYVEEEEENDEEKEENGKEK